MGYIANELAIISTLNKLLDKIQHKIIRDFYEIEYLQKSQYFPQKFVANLTESTHQYLVDNLLAYYPNNGVILNGEMIVNETENGAKANDFFIVDSLSDQVNLCRSIPFVASSITLVNDLNSPNQTTIATVINYPILNITVSGYKDSDILCNQKKIQITSNGNPEQLCIISNIANDKSNDHYEFYNFNSLTYEALLIFQNKADLLIKSYSDPYQLYALEFIAKRANFIFENDLDKKIVKIANNKSIANT